MQAFRNHIAHILPRLDISAVYSLVATIIKHTGTTHQHTVFHETPMANIDLSLSMQLQAYSADVVQAETITPDMLDRNVYTGAMFYNVEGHAGLGRVLPSVYMAYGRRNDDLAAGITVPCSAYAAGHDLNGAAYDRPLDKEQMIPPIIQSRGMRRVRIRSKMKQFTVGLLTSGSDGKFPQVLACDLAGRLSDEIPLYMTVLPKFSYPGLPLTIEDRQKRGKLVGCMLRPLAGFFYLLHLDALVYATAPEYYEPAGTFVIEAAAAGVPIVCERRGMMADTIQHGWNGLLFDNVTEAIEHVMRLKSDDKLRDQLAANGQLWASWYDVSVHLGRLKAIWRALGI